MVIEKPSPTEILARYNVEAKFEDFPDIVVKKAKQFILDTLGCALGGSATMEANVMMCAIKSLGGRPESTIIGFGDMIDCVRAGYVNSYLADLLDFEDSTSGHSSANIVAPALAAGEKVKASGRDLITATVVAFETTIRIGSALKSSEIHGSRMPSYQSFGAVAAASKILKLNLNQTINAYGFTGGNAPLPLSFSSVRPYARFVYPLSWDKSGSLAQGSLVGILGALLAQEGYRASQGILDEDKQRFWLMEVLDCDYERMTGGLGGEYEMVKLTLKPWPACRRSHPTLTALSEVIRENGLKPEEVELVVAKTGNVVRKYFMHYSPEDMITAEFTLPHPVACLLLDMKPGPGWYIDDMHRKPNVLEMARKVKAELDPEVERLWLGRRWTGGVLVYTKDGRVLSKQVNYMKGSPESPLSKDEILDKFRTNSSFKLEPIQVNDIIEMIERLEELDDVSKLANKLAPNQDDHTKALLS